ncbi:MAG: hypothetical protein E4H13_15400 [Calditrichales bacterium]|nr:MAG: hypothetical protein E4H13_15400 [Calditrichales bacterium]
MDPNVKINIYKNSIDRANLVEQLDSRNSGSKSWTIPGSYAAGKYIIRIKAADGSCRGDSGIFHIQDRRLIKINITSPSGGDRVEIPGNFSVRWNVEGGNLVENIKLIVKKAGQVLSTKLIDNTGAFDTSLPDTISDGNDYTIRLEDADDASHFAESKNFEIYHSRAPSISVLKPLQYSVISGETMKIQWVCWGFDKEVNVELLMDGNPAGFLCRNLRDDFYNWKVNRPAGAPTNNYYHIRISSSVNSSISEISNGFFILLPADLLVYSKGIFEKENFVKGEMTNLRFIVKDPSEGRAQIPVKIAIDFIRGHIKNPREVSMNKVYALANTKYTGNKIAYVNPGTTTAFELPVTISDQPGEYTVKITVLPDLPIDPIPGNNTIYGYYKVVLKLLKIKK